MDTKNKYGLTRTIDSETKRKIRQECGFGCINCGKSIYQYEHIIPEFCDSKSHDVDKIGLLCAGCHDLVTKGLLPKELIQKKRLNPFCLEKGSSKYDFYIDPEKDIIIELGKAKFINTNNIIVIDSCSILSVYKPERKNSPPIISANFFDKNGNKIAWIDNNEWNGNSYSFDIESVGTTIKIRSELYKIVLEIEIVHPNTFQINNLKLQYNGKSVVGNRTSGYVFKTSSSSTTIGLEELVYKNSPFGISIQGNKISRGSSIVAEYINLKGEKQLISGYYEFDRGELEVKYGNTLTPGILFKGDGKSYDVKIKFDIPESELPKIGIDYKIKQDRNHLCKCGSNKKYKKCCLIKTNILKDIINKPRINNLIQKIKKQYKASTSNSFNYRETYEYAWIHWDENYPHLIINTSKPFAESNIGYALLFWILRKEGYNYIDGLYSDDRETILQSLQKMLLSIPIIELMKVDGFNVAKFFEDEIMFYKEKMEEKVIDEDDNKLSVKSLIEATKIIRLKYNVEFLNHDHINTLNELFISKAPYATEICEKLLNTIKLNNVYDISGYNKCLFMCVFYLNHLTKGWFSEALDKLSPAVFPEKKNPL